MLFEADGAQFTTGRAQFFDAAPAADQGTAKIYVRIEPQGFGAEILAELDTGAAWSVLRMDVAEALALLDGAGEAVTLRTRHGPIAGRLERAALRILADDGDDLDIEAVIFVSREWPGGTFLGYSGLLERVRFAVDPQRYLFYFGPG